MQSNVVIPNTENSTGMPSSYFSLSVASSKLHTQVEDLTDHFLKEKKKPLTEGREWDC